jgi:hypothetical protein
LQSAEQGKYRDAFRSKKRIKRGRKKRLPLGFCFGSGYDSIEFVRIIVIGGRLVMKTAIKAALLSALVFPGLGQMYLKRYARGLIPMVLTLTGLGLLMMQATVGVLRELDKMQIQGGLVDLNAVANRAAASSASGDWYSPLIMPMIVVCWLFSMIDAYMLGKGKEPPADQNRAKGVMRSGRE